MHNNIPQLFNCEYCSYTSNKKYNLTRHLIRHDHTQFKQTNNETEEVLKNQIVIIENKCESCLKSFSTKYNLIRHLKNCKGIILNKKCEYCNKEFKHISTKITHLKTCKFKINKNKDNVNINVGTINNINVVNNITNNNINIVVFDPLKIDGSIFKTDHIDLNFLNLILKSAENNAVSLYTQKILDNPENHCIVKSNLRSMVSDVHTGQNNWTKYYDIELYPMIIREISNGFQSCISKQNENKKDFKKFNKLIEYLDYFSEDGYCNDDTISAKIKKEFKEQIQKTKLIFYNLYKNNL